MMELLAWVVLGLAICAALYSLPIIVSGLLFGMSPVDPRMFPPIPPTREEARRRARYFEDVQ